MRGVRMLVLGTQEYAHMVGFDLRITDYAFSWQGLTETTPLISRLVKGFLVSINAPYHWLNGFIGVDVKTPTQLSGKDFETLHRVNIVGMKGKYFLTFDHETDQVLLIEYVPE